MTYNLPQPAGASTGGDNVKTFVTAALLPFSAGMLVLAGYLMIGGFGAVIGVIAAVFGVIWWRSVNDGIFPAMLKKASLITLIVASVALFALAWAVA